MSSSPREDKFSLPAVVLPTDTVCFRVNVPNDEAYISAFKGALLDLAQWVYWARDDAHTGVLAARRGKQMWEEISDCTMPDVRQNPLNPCILQKSNDGVTWTDFADISLCVDQMFPPDKNPPGTIQPGENPGGPTPPVGACYQYQLTVTPEHPALIPIDIVPGFTIQLLDSFGAWSDGQLGRFISVWQCPDGKVFAAGSCVGTPVPTTDPTDPLSTAAHMELILSAPDGTFHRIIDGSVYTVPPGMPTGNFELVCNQGSASFDLGSVLAHIKVCNGPACETELVRRAGWTGSIVKTGCHYTLTSSIDIDGNRSIFFATAGDINVNLSSVIFSSVVSHSQYLSHTGDPHNDAGIISPLYSVNLIWLGAGAAQTVDFDLTDI